MAFKFLPDSPDFGRLESTLNNAKVAKSNNALYQVILGLIKGLGLLQDQLAKLVKDIQAETKPGAIPNTYTPTLTNVANLTASTAYECQYSKNGRTVTVSGKIDIDPTNAAVVTQLGISLPIPSDFLTAQQCAGVAFASGIAMQGAAILGDTTNNRAQLEYVSGDLTNQPMYFIFQYQIIL